MVKIKKLFWVLSLVTAVGMPSVYAADEKGVDPINNTQQEGSVWDSTCDVVGGCAKGAGKFVVSVFDFFLVEPVRLIHDDGVMIYWATDQNEEGMQWVLNGEAWSNYSKSWHVAALTRDQSQPLLQYVLSNLGTAAYEIPKNMAVGVVNMPWNMQEAWERGDYETVGSIGAEGLSFLVPAAWGLRNVTLTIPRNSIRYVPVAAGENQFALAAVATQTIALEGDIAIPAGATLGIFMGRSTPNREALSKLKRERSQLRKDDKLTPPENERTSGEMDQIRKDMKNPDSPNNESIGNFIIY